MTTVLSRPALILITGSRTWPYIWTVEQALVRMRATAKDCGFPDIHVIHGDAGGVDFLADRWARRNHVPRTPYPADWTGPCADTCPPGHRKYNRKSRSYCPFAGHRRNQLMVDQQPDAALAFCHNQSTGTLDCIRRIQKADIPLDDHYLITLQDKT